MSTVGVSFDSIVLPMFRSNSLGLFIEPEEMIFSVLDPSVEM
jgi:hypothetical protein